MGRNFCDFLARPFQRPGANDTAEGKGKKSENLSVEDRHSLSSPGSLVVFTFGKSLDGGPSSALLPLPSPVHLGQALPLLRADAPPHLPVLLQLILSSHILNLSSLLVLKGPKAFMQTELPRPS